ncbi:MAG: argininosuccinate lyase, partial [Pelagibacterales bacterium]|nr:argininosuccinate lyase [Pelagibacterales bacterium]
GTIVKIAENKGIELHELKLSEMQKVEKRITKEIFKVLSVENSVASRTSFGGTSQVRVKEQISVAKKFLKSC